MVLSSLQNIFAVHPWPCLIGCLRLTFMNSFMVVGGYFLAGPWMRTLSLGHTNQPME